MMNPGGRKTVSTVMSEINVTPFVDVMLVLLVIFMVTAPLLQQGIDVQLPRETTAEKEIREEMIVTITKNEQIFFNKRRVTLNELEDGLKLVSSRVKNPEIFLRADKDVPYGFVVRVVARIKRAGIERLGMITEPI